VGVILAAWKSVEEQDAAASPLPTLPIEGRAFRREPEFHLNFQVSVDGIMAINQLRVG
jgi:hypothetical protein